MKNKDFYTVNSQATDVSKQVKDFNTPAIALPLLSSEYIYVGYYKPFRQFYIDFSVLNTVDTGVTFEYWDGSAWVDVPQLVDETDDFKKSGFVYWEKPEDWAATTFNSEEQYYMRMSPGLDISVGTMLNGINVLFSNDSDLEGIRSNIVSKHNNGSSWVKKHEAARKYIIQNLRNNGHRKVKVDETTAAIFGNDSDVKTFSNLTQFDFLDPFELREASKFFALSFIYLDELSDEEDDKWERAGTRHEQRAAEALNLFMLRIDKDDDGVEDINENEGNTSIGLVWE